MAKYPEQMKVFCAWVDEYKARNEWGSIFKNGEDKFVRDTGKPLKYHELPIAMQFGIFYQFTVESEEYDLFYQDVAVPKTMDDIKDCIEGFFFLQKMKA